MPSQRTCGDRALRRRVLALGLLALATGCRYQRLEPPEVPVVQITTTRGTELGVSTDEGILFLGRTAQQGPAKVFYFLGPSPLVEVGEVLPLGGPLSTVQLEVDIPTIPISFEPVRPGEELVLMGLDGPRVWQHPVRAVDNAELVNGTVLEQPAGLELQPWHIGAGVFRRTDGGLALVGLLKGRARIDGEPDMLLMAGLPEFRLAFLEPHAAVPKIEVLYRSDGARTIRTKR